MMSSMGSAIGLPVPTDSRSEPPESPRYRADAAARGQAHLVGCTVPVRDETERLLGARVRRATGAYGGYGPSATFVLAISDGRSAFFKGVYPLPEGSAVRWMLDEEERVYRVPKGGHRRRGRPPTTGRSDCRAGTRCCIESVAGEKIPPWTISAARRATRSYARFHAGTIGKASARLAVA